MPRALCTLSFLLARAAAGRQATAHARRVTCAGGWAHRCVCRGGGHAGCVAAKQGRSLFLVWGRQERSLAIQRRSWASPFDVLPAASQQCGRAVLRVRVQRLTQQLEDGLLLLPVTSIGWNCSRQGKSPSALKSSLEGLVWVCGRLPTCAGTCVLMPTAWASDRAADRRSGLEKIVESVLPWGLSFWVRRQQGLITCWNSGGIKRGQ